MVSASWEMVAWRSFLGTDLCLDLESSDGGDQSNEVELELALELQGKKENRA
jgi:hypothetical protein